MEFLLSAIGVCLLVLLWKYRLLKTNIRRFSQELEKLKDSDYRQPVKVTDFEIADGIVLQADAHCLTRILQNLLSNAQKYTTDSFGVTLKQEGERVMLRVRNTLADSTSLDMDRVFEPFYRMDARTAGGSGLGLYVVKLLCDRLGWSVCAQLDEGSFEVTIGGEMQ